MKWKSRGNPWALLISPAIECIMVWLIGQYNSFDIDCQNHYLLEQCNYYLKHQLHLLLVIILWYLNIYIALALFHYCYRVFLLELAKPNVVLFFCIFFIFHLRNSFMFLFLQYIFIFPSCRHGNWSGWHGSLHAINLVSYLVHSLKPCLCQSL